MTDKQRVVYNFIRDNKFASYRDIAKGLGLAGATSVSYHINKLEKLGLIRKVGKSTRKDYVVSPAVEDIDIEYFDEHMNRIASPEFTRSGT